MLVLREVSIPRWPFGPVALFATPAKALNHLCDHVLTRPEANYWPLLVPAIGDHLDPADENLLFHFARGLYTDRATWADVQALYDGYTAAVAQAMSDAVRHGWYWVQQEPDGPTYRGLGVSGVYVIWRQNLVLTGMLLGYSAPPGEAEDAGGRKTNPLPRQHAWRYRGATLRHDDAHFPPVGTDPQQTLYHIFKKSAVKIRREYKHACQAGLVSDGGGYLGSLLGGVPSFETWQRLLTRVPAAQSVSA